MLSRLLLPLLCLASCCTNQSGLLLLETVLTSFPFLLTTAATRTRSELSNPELLLLKLISRELCELDPGGEDLEH